MEINNQSNSKRTKQDNLITYRTQYEYNGEDIIKAVSDDGLHKVEFNRVNFETIKENYRGKKYHIHFIFYISKEGDILAQCRICSHLLRVQRVALSSNLIRHLEDAVGEKKKITELYKYKYGHELALTASGAKNENENENDALEKKYHILYKLGRMIIQHNLPLSIFTSSGGDKGTCFSELVEAIGFPICKEGAASISYRYLRKIINIIFSHFWLNVREQIKNNTSKFTLIVDISSVGECHGTISSTSISYLDDSMSHQIVHLGIHPYYGSKTVKQFKNHLLNILESFSLPLMNIHGIVSDMGSENIGLRNELGLSMQIYCISHSINNSVCRAIKNTKAESIIDLVRALMSYIRMSQARCNLLSKMQLENNDPVLHPIRECETRWLSNFLVLIQIFRMQDSIVSFCNKEGMKHLIPDFSYVSQLIGVIEPFYEALKQTQYIGCSNLVLCVYSLFRLSYITNRTNDCLYLIPHKEGTTTKMFGNTPLLANEMKFSALDTTIQSLLTKLRNELLHRFFWKQQSNIPISDGFRHLKHIHHIVYDVEQIGIMICLHPCYSSLWFPLAREEKNELRSYIRSKTINYIQHLTKAKEQQIKSSDNASINPEQETSNSVKNKKENSIEEMLDEIEALSEEFAYKYPYDKRYNCFKEAEATFKAYWNKEKNLTIKQVVRNLFGSLGSSCYAESTFSTVNDLMQEKRRSLKPLLQWQLMLMKQNFNFLVEPTLDSFQKDVDMVSLESLLFKNSSDTLSTETIDEHSEEKEEEKNVEICKEIDPNIIKSSEDLTQSISMLRRSPRIKKGRTHLNNICLEDTKRKKRSESEELDNQHEALPKTRSISENFDTMQNNESDINNDWGDIGNMQI